MAPDPKANAGGDTMIVRTRGTVIIDVEACKGCDLCIDACRPGVLTMTTNERNTRGYRYPELRPGCTACQACSQICPDFVFQVWKYESPIDETYVVSGPEGDLVRAEGEAAPVQAEQP
jgi:2-oxoglutarate ferredoxin oxidoreductase subunit delta